MSEYCFGFKISENTHIYNAVVNALKRSGMPMTTGNEWNLLWTGSVKDDLLKELN